MKYILFSISLLWGEYLSGQDRSIEIDKVVTSQHQTIIKGQKITFQATTGTQPFGMRTVELLLPYIIPIMNEPT
jgi:hypothetical protein